jgi:hypothetical protein
MPKSSQRLADRSQPPRCARAPDSNGSRISSPAWRRFSPHHASFRRQRPGARPLRRLSAARRPAQYSHASAACRPKNWPAGDTVHRRPTQRIAVSLPCPALARFPGCQRTRTLERTTDAAACSTIRNWPVSAGPNTGSYWRKWGKNHPQKNGRCWPIWPLAGAIGLQQTA